MANTQYLQLNKGLYRVRMQVPEAARAVLKVNNLLAFLGTSNLAEANRRKHKHIAAFKQLIEDALKGRVDPATVEALAIRKHGSEDEAAIIAEEIAKSNPTKAQTFYDIASGSAIPLTAPIEAWLKDAHLTNGVASEARRAVRWLEDWCGRKRILKTVQAITKKHASSFVTEVLVPDRSYNSVNKYIATLSGYWKFLIKKGEIEDNVWLGQRLAKPKAHLTRNKGTVKRPFTDDEITTLLTSKSSEFMHDIMMVAALSGMRLEEIASLRVKDTEGGIFNITRGKTPASIRKVPIHSALKEIIEWRMVDDGEALIFHELPKPIPSEPDRYGAVVSKVFTYYRRKVGVDEMAQGARKSNIDFHSFRRWFVTKAAQALAEGAQGYNHYTLADVVGHDRKQMELGMTFGVYSGASANAAKRACIEAVRLPL